MNMDKFNQKLGALNKRLAELLESNGTTPQPELPPEPFQELYIALEELNVAEEELQQQNQELAATREMVEAERQRYQDLFEEAPDAYLVTDAIGTIQEANCAAAKLLNIKQQFLIGKPLTYYISESERQAFRSKLNQLRQIDRVQEWEVLLHPRRSAPFNAALTVTVVRQEGKLIALRWLLRDITERKQAEAALLRAQVAEAARVELEKEITTRKRVEEQLQHTAFHDALTGLPNRALFMNRLERALDYRKRHEDYMFAVLFLDLDRFKVINDSLGHTEGDRLLIAFASRLASLVRPTDIVARLGGDEFTILLEGIKDISDALKVAERIQAELRLPFELGKQEVFTTASIGIALSAIGYDRPSDILRDADIAMYRAKSQGKACYKIFNTNMHVRAMARLQLENDLRRAIEHQEFRIHYQPIVALDTGLLAGFEALVRWQHPNRGLVLPTDFIPVAQETGLSIPIDRWVIATACRQVKQWLEKYPVNGRLTISVNVCSPQFAQPDLIDHIDEVLRDTSLDAGNLKLEFTENVIMKSEFATAKLAQLRALGVQLCIDNFGTGYSSLSRLHHCPINELKIDRSFVSKMGVEQGNLEIVETIVTLAHKLGVNVTAEGVETAEELVQLRSLRCEYGQGYFFSPPLDSETTEALIEANPHWQESVQNEMTLSGE